MHDGSACSAECLVFPLYISKGGAQLVALAAGPLQPVPMKLDGACRFKYCTFPEPGSKNAEARQRPAPCRSPRRRLERRLPRFVTG
jgi:hypothetical protein